MALNLEGLNLEDLKYEYEHLITHRKSICKDLEQLSRERRGNSKQAKKLLEEKLECENDMARIRNIVSGGK